MIAASVDVRPAPGTRVSRAGTTGTVCAHTTDPIVTMVVFDGEVEPVVFYDTELAELIPLDVDEEPTEHCGLQYRAALCLADLTRHLDPRLPCSLDIGPSGHIGILLHRPAKLRTAAEIADRLALLDHSAAPFDADETRVRHSWRGVLSGFKVAVDWIDVIGPER